MRPPQVEEAWEAACLDVLHSRCAIQDVFADSRFLKHEALQALVAALIAAPGPLPRVHQHGGHGGGGADGRGGGEQKLADARAAPGPLAVDWDAAELCLDLLLVVLLRNRDRLPLLWPPVFEHLAAIIRGKAVRQRGARTPVGGAQGCARPGGRERRRPRVARAAPAARRSTARSWPPRRLACCACASACCRPSRRPASCCCAACSSCPASTRRSRG